MHVRINAYDFVIFELIQKYLKMKKNTLVLFVVGFLITSCGKSNEEKLFTEFKSKELQTSLKTTPDELNFKIESIEEVKEIKASDSIKYLHDKLVEVFKTEEKEKDTLTYDFAIKEVDKLINATQELILLRAKAGRSYENYESKEQRDELIKQKVYLGAWKQESENYSKNKKEVLAKEYKVKYVIDNPLLKIKQNISSQIFSNKDNTKIIKEIINQ